MLFLTFKYSYAQNRTWTDPSTCLRNAECPLSKYCNTNDIFPTYRCESRASLNEDCNPTECSSGLFCDIFGILDPGPSVCRKLISPNSTCADSLSLEPENCQPPYMCSPKTKTCQPFQPSFEGEPCFSSLYCDRGLGCKRGVCVPLLRDYSNCSVEDVCEGFCLSRREGGICVPLPKLGDRCTTQVGCAQYDKKDLIICNVPQGRTGQCVKQSTLITKLGKDCNEALDTCDASRGLSCRYSESEGKFVCHQAAASLDIEANRFCDSESKFSKCLPFLGAPQECRVMDPGAIGKLFDNFFQCSERKLHVGVGSICNNPAALCPEGTSCFTFKSSIPVARYCKRIKSQGESCANGFENECDFSLYCVDGTCQSVQDIKGLIRPSVTHVGEFGICGNELPCIPGTTCTEVAGIKRCLLPTVVIGREKECSSSIVAIKVCEEGLVCRGKANGLFRCLDPADVGEYCSRDEDCKSMLKCATKASSDARCYDPENSLDIGEMCGREGDLPCGGAHGELLKCTPWMDTKVPRCQKVRGLYAECKEEEYITCIDESKCISTVCLQS